MIDFINVFAPEASGGQKQEGADPVAIAAKAAKPAAPEQAQPATSPVAKAAKVHPPDWWRDQYEERAAIREYDGHYSRAEAERLAWGELENRWHKEHGERVPVDICAGCHRPIGVRPALDVADGNRVHDHPDHACLIEFGKRWRGAATAALIAIGLKAPAEQ